MAEFNEHHQTTLFNGRSAKHNCFAKVIVVKEEGETSTKKDALRKVTAVNMRGRVFVISTNPAAGVHNTFVYPDTVMLDIVPQPSDPIRQD